MNFNDLNKFQDWNSSNKFILTQYSPFNTYTIGCYLQFSYTCTYTAYVNKELLP